MKEKQVNIETGKLATKFGYKDSSKGCYYYLDKGKCEMWTSKFGGISGTEKCYFKPTQAILQKWLRDKKNVDVEPYLVLMLSNDREIEQSNDIKEYMYKININGISQYIAGSKLFTSYETALEKGLYRALELLESNDYEKQLQ